MSEVAQDAYTVTWLEMAERPSWPRPSLPGTVPTMLLAAEAPPVRWFLSLYEGVGAAYQWDDWQKRPAAELEAFVSHPDVTIYTLMRQGWSAGFFMLDSRVDGVCDLAYFGLMPEAVGAGLGGWFLRTAIHTGWDRPGTRKLTVNTCTLDHPAALPLYQKCGFVPVRREDRLRSVTYDH
ncbi:GNAT family N-acetyltransferase [Paroceanicella profunda]|uniref:GNAT family N-acetyltransferase n=1 Tax=Paroceanicella profunda TaxID=2579971 RepID=A0A5B8FUL4_9RHOB|nr:GNAT family N-acetyltransferase [Paroceanicella profunda]QDL90760.1 GNAT family N-acetyltransferase [Paroceanicella profunda]